MASKQHLSSHQRGIVKRYYENLDTIQLQKLGEIVSDLFLAADKKALDRLWKRAETALVRAQAPRSAIEKTISTRDVEALARLVTQLTAGAGEAATHNPSHRASSGGRGGQREPGRPRPG